MHIHKNYIHDKTVLTLLVVNITFFIVVCLSVLLKVNRNTGQPYVVQYRQNLDALAVKSGPVSEIYSFLFFSVLVLVASFLLSAKMYGHRRHVATMILGMTPFLFMIALATIDRLLTIS